MQQRRRRRTHIADQRDPERARGHHAVRHRPVRASAGAGIPDVGAEPGEPRLRHAQPERVERPREIAPADGGRIKPEAVQHLDGRPTGDEIGRRRSRYRVPRRHADRRATALRGCPVGRRLDRRRARCHRPAKITQGQHAEQNGVRRRLRRGGTRGGAEEPPDLVSHLGRDDPPVGFGVVAGNQVASAPDFRHQQIADVLVAVVHHRRVPDHGEAASTRLAIAVHRHGEAVGRRDRLALEGEVADTASDRQAQIDVVIRPRDHVVAVAEHRRVEGGVTDRVGGVVADAFLKVGFELGPGEPHRPERVLVRIQREDVAQADVAVGEAGARAECGGRGQLGARPSPLHPLDERDDRGRLGPPQCGGHGTAGFAEGLVRPLPHSGAERRLARGEARRDRHPGEVHRFRADPGRAPASACPDDLEVHHGERLGVGLRLHEVHATEDGVAHPAVGVPDDHQVGPNGESGQRDRGVLGTYAGRIVGAGFLHAAVEDGDDDVGLAAQGGQHLRDAFGDRRHPHPATDRLAAPDHHTGCREARDAHSDPVPRQYRVRWKL